jgi:predicted molibdopterin-dependent oxidoreductase YjgC
MTIRLTINDQLVEAEPGQSVLEAARASGIIIPTLCHHRDLSPVGSCRLCVVEVEGAPGEIAACTLAAQNGMVVRTETPALGQFRKTILEMLLSSYDDDGNSNVVRAKTEFMHWANQYGAKRLARSAAVARFPVAADPNPFIRVDMNKCILCTRCVRACAEVQGRFVWGVSQRGCESEIAAGAGTMMLEARCESCGLCAAVCPTGALEDKLSLGAGQPDRLVTTTCAYCGVGCQLDLNVKVGRIIRVTSNPQAPVNGNHLCVKGRYGYDFVHPANRP